MVGPEAPLAAGITDLFESKGLAVFGATKAAAEIESSKVFSKELMLRHAIPCPASASFTDYEEAKEYLQKQKPPIVIKADGLAAGKGVIIAETMDAARQALQDLMQHKTLGSAADRVLIEEHLAGREMSVFTFSDGQTLATLASACDYKRIYDDNKGPNTGGMGSYSPPPFLNPPLAHLVNLTIMEPTVLAMKDEGRPYKGMLYGGLMINNNLPKVLEFNARFGDPETQVVLPRLKTDLLEIMLAVVENRLDKINIECSEEACVGVVMASAGYPGKYRTGYPVSGLEDVDGDIIVFHAGTKPDADGRVLTDGGRVLTVAATGKDLATAREKVYNNISRIKFEGCYYRRDIADLK